MTSTLIISEDKQKSEAYALGLCAEQAIQPVDITFIKRPDVEKKETKKTPQSIGIELIKLMQAKLFLRPVQSPAKAVIILDAHTMTVEAQNALLKVLEEPPQNTLLILTSENKDALLPTIISRCKLIHLGVQKLLSEQERSEYGQVLQLMERITISDALKLAESIGKNKPETVLWIEKMSLITREKIHEDFRYLSLAQALQETYKLLRSTNVNTRMAMEQLFLRIIR